MPRNFKGRKFNKRQQRKVRGRGAMRKVNFRSTIVPDRTQVTLKVSSLVTFTFLSNSFYATYKGNDLVNPGNGTWVNQPAGFIDWMQFYKYFRIIHSNIKFQVINDGDNARNRGIWVCIYPTLYADSSLISGGYINAMAQSYARGKFIGSPTGQDKATVSNSMSTSKYFGYNVYNDTDFLGTISTSPNKEWFWGIACSGLSDGGTEFAVLTGVVTIYYTAQLLERAPITMTFPGLSISESLAQMEKPFIQNSQIPKIPNDKL